jgi:hypothetical protein
VTEDQPQVIASSNTEALLLAGQGTIVPGTGQTGMTLGEVIVSPSAEIAAEGLTITGRLSMNGNAILKALGSHHIEIPTDRVNIRLSSSGKDLPTLDLGLIGDRHTRVPKTLIVDAPTGLSAEEVSKFSHVIISGTTLGNCEAWQSRLELSSASFTSQCVDGTGAKLLAGARSLVIKGVPKGTETPDGFDFNSWLFRGIVAGVVVLVVIVVVVVVVVRRKRHRFDYSV